MPSIFEINIVSINLISGYMLIDIELVLQVELESD